MGADSWSCCRPVWVRVEASVLTMLGWTEWSVLPVGRAFAVSAETSLDALRPPLRKPSRAGVVANGDLPFDVDLAFSNSFAATGQVPSSDALAVLSPLVLASISGCSSAIRSTL